MPKSRLLPDFRDTLDAILFVVGMGILLFGIIPMAMGLTVDNGVIDDGPHPGDDQIMREWDSWAFTPRNGMLVLAGFGILGIHFLRYREPKDQRGYGLHVVLCVGAAAFMAALITGWFCL